MKTWFRQWRARISARVARSRRVFLLGMIIACGVEAVTDWNTALKDINTLRGNVRAKATSYATFLRKPALDALQTSNLGELRSNIDAGFEDDETVYVALFDHDGHPVTVAIRPEYQPVFTSRKQFLERLMARDVTGMLHAPEAYKRRVANSRYRDFAQWWTDTLARLTRSLVTQGPPSGRFDLMLYQDRVRDENRQRDETMTWEVSVLRDDAGQNLGALLIGFDVRRVNDMVGSRYLKCLALTAFFVALIVLQRITSRRDQLEMLEVQRRYAVAKNELVEATPKGLTKYPKLLVAGAVDQATRLVDGMLWGVKQSAGRILVAVVDPDGDGIQAAVVGLHVLKAFHACREELGADLDRATELLGAAAMEVPLSSEIALSLLSIDPESGEFEARLNPCSELRLVERNATETPRLETAEPRPGVLGPVRACSGCLPDGALLLLAGWGSAADKARLDTEAVAAFLRRNHDAALNVRLQDAASWARGKSPRLDRSDLVIVGLVRTA